MRGKRLQDRSLETDGRMSVPRSINWKPFRLELSFDMLSHLGQMACGAEGKDLLSERIVTLAIGRFAHGSLPLSGPIRASR